jgi:hypothetical protein
VLRRSLVVAGVLTSLACGDSTAPPPFPAVSGTYQIDLTFDGVPSSFAFGGGTITIVQASRNEGTLTGSANVTATAGSTTIVLTDFNSASVTEAGDIRFRLNPPASTTIWGFDGTVTNGGARMSGTHALVSPTSTITGTWTATRR